MLFIFKGVLMKKTEYVLIGNAVIIKNYKDSIFLNSAETDLSGISDDKLKQEILENGYASRTEEDTLEDIEEERLSKIDNFENKLKGTEEKMKEIEEKVSEISNNELHPDRYGGDTPYETKKVAEKWHTSEQYEGWILITLEKYLSRFGKKDDKIKEAKKILNYAQFLLEFEEKQAKEKR